MKKKIILDFLYIIIMEHMFDFLNRVKVNPTEILTKGLCSVTIKEDGQAIQVVVKDHTPSFHKRASAPYNISKELTPLDLFLNPSYNFAINHFNKYLKSFLEINDCILNFEIMDNHHIVDEQPHDPYLILLSVYDFNGNLIPQRMIACLLRCQVTQIFYSGTLRIKRAKQLINYCKNYCNPKNTESWLTYNQSLNKEKFTEELKYKFYKDIFEILRKKKFDDSKYKAKYIEGFVFTIRYQNRVWNIKLDNPFFIKSYQKYRHDLDSNKNLLLSSVEEEILSYQYYLKHQDKFYVNMNNMDLGALATDYFNHITKVENEKIFKIYKSISLSYSKLWIPHVDEILQRIANNYGILDSMEPDDAATNVCIMIDKDPMIGICFSIYILLMYRFRGYLKKGITAKTFNYTMDPGPM